MTTETGMTTDTADRLPYKWTARVRDRLLDAARAGVSLELCADHAGISAQTLHSWMTDDRPEMQAFFEEFTAARAEKDLERARVIDFAAETDWKAAQYQLQVNRREYRLSTQQAVLEGRDRHTGEPLSEKQIDRRIIAMIANPDKRMQGLLAQAVREMNPRALAIIRARVEELQEDERNAKAITVEAEPAPQIEPSITGEPTHEVSPELELRLSQWRDVLRRHDRVLLYGGPDAGKTTVFAPEATDRAVIHTDDWKHEKDWNAVGGHLERAARQHGRFVIEGVRATSILGRGVPVDVLVVLTKPLVPFDAMSKEYQAMWKGRATNLERVRAEYPALKIVEI